MKNTNSTALIVGLIAGLASAALIYSAGRGTALALLLIFTSPLPIYIAGFAYGTMAAIGATVGLLGTVLVVSSLENMMAMGLILALPAALIGHQANLAQPTEDGSSLIWFPLEKLLSNLMLYIGVGFILIGFMTQFNVETLSEQNLGIAKQIFTSMGDAPPISDAELREMVKFTFTLLPFLIPSYWLFMHVVNAVIAEKIVRSSGRMARPAADLAVDATLPSILVLPTLASLACTFLLPPPISHVFAVMAGTLLTGFAIIGLATTHAKARQRPGGGLFIFGIYFLILTFFFLPILFFAGLGMVRMWSGGRTNNTTT